ncbi:unnamed protein product [Lymnaea stagnalis]|uniref:RNA helicase n=1 Tax=Lymnaea stagnalis TaxID=6523 RepID=A0AAV2HCM6_LYMST
MFSLISKIVGYFFGDSPSEKSTNSSNQSYLNQTDDFSYLDAPFLTTAKENVKIQALNGKITHLFEGHGLINGDIYFSSGNFQRGEQIEVGDNVEVKAVQHTEDGGWYAEDLKVTNNDWSGKVQDDPEEIDISVLQSQVVMGKVTSINNVAGKINKDIDFDISDCKDEYLPMRGDWVSANVKEFDKQLDVVDDWSSMSVIKVKRAFNISPSRQCITEGVVSAVMQDHGYIEEKIYFDKTACLNGYWPKRQDVVKVVAVENSRGKTCEWRALSLVPLSSESQVYRSRQYREPARNVNSTWLVPGQRPRRFPHQVQLPVKLPYLKVPVELERAVLDGEELTTLAPYLMQELTFKNYVRRMSTLVHLEEIQMQLDIREFDLTRVCLQSAGEYLALTVPGLAEGRPSVLIGDKILLSSPSDLEGPSYEGFVHELTCTDVLLKFNPEFHARYNGEDYNVQFTFSRKPFCRCQQAASLAVQYLPSKVLFPTQVEIKPPQVSLEDVMLSEDTLLLSSESPFSPGSTSSQTSDYFDKDTRLKVSMSSSFKTNQRENIPPGSPHTFSNSCASNHKQRKFRNGKKDFHFFNPSLNDRQKTAVMKVLLGQARPIPYVIFGPPGRTGKTITVVEAILQIFTQIPSSRIIACTPSNSAADLIAERLHMSQVVEQTQMVRLNGFQRSLESVPETILKYCRVADDMEVISHYRIIVSTCTMSGEFYGLGVRSGHFTHVFIDECGQATEPECMIPVGLISGGDGQIILAGDPKQLGPILMSPFAKMYGLELSFLERLMLREAYQRDETFAEHGGFNPALVTMLVNNYRSHPSIIELSSHMFYYGQLKPHAHPNRTHTLTHWELLPKTGFPVIFHGVRGEDFREKNSPSWFNPGETIQVIQYLQGVLKEGVNPDDVGIITPYRKQVEKIRLMIDRLGMPEVKIGSVEEFQGQEYQVVIISTVRSNEKLIGSDIRHSLGFLSNPKRFNVSITRAICMMIVVGNPLILAQDLNWRMLIKYCVDNGGYTGCELPDLKAKKYQTEEMQEIFKS